VSLGTKLGLSVFLASDPGAARFAVPPAPEMLEQNQNYNSQQTEWRAMLTSGALRFIPSMIIN
jgi:hypothetical protein